MISRQALISTGQWETATVQTREQGEIRLARPDARASMRLRALHERRERGEDVEVEIMATMLQAACIDSAGWPLFGDAAAAEELLASISTETLTELITAAGKLTAGAVPTVASPGKSAAS